LEEKFYKKIYSPILKGKRSSRDDFFSPTCCKGKIKKEINAVHSIKRRGRLGSKQINGIFSCKILHCSNFVEKNCHIYKDFLRKIENILETWPDFCTWFK
jgi:hypothetical protein